MANTITENLTRTQAQSARELLGLSIDELAERAGLTPETITRFEYGAPLSSSINDKIEQVLRASSLQVGGKHYVAQIKAHKVRLVEAALTRKGLRPIRFTLTKQLLGLVGFFALLVAAPFALDYKTYLAKWNMQKLNAHSEAYFHSENFAGRVRVVDGDTLEFNGIKDHVRIKDFDAPETGGTAKCALEKQLGKDSTQAAQEIISMAFNIVPDLRPPLKHDRYGRIVTTIEINHNDSFADLMVDSGHGSLWDYDGGEPKPDWCD